MDAKFVNRVNRSIAEYPARWNLHWFVKLANWRGRHYLTHLKRASVVSVNNTRIKFSIARMPSPNFQSAHAAAVYLSVP